MPLVNVKLTGAPTKEEKEMLIREFTKILVEKLGKNPATTMVVIEEISGDNWGIGGESVSVRNSRK